VQTRTIMSRAVFVRSRSTTAVRGISPRGYELRK
jgi:hypothetical protein